MDLSTENRDEGCPSYIVWIDWQISLKVIRDYTGADKVLNFSERKWKTSHLKAFRDLIVLDLYCELVWIVVKIIIRIQRFYPGGECANITDKLWVNPELQPISYYFKFNSSWNTTHEFKWVSK